MDKLQKARSMINDIDTKMAELFEKRMEAARLVAEHKQEQYRRKDEYTNSIFHIVFVGKSVLHDWKINK